MKVKFSNISKKITALLLAVNCIFSVVAFGGCNKRKSVTMKINNVVIEEDVFAYFLDKATVELSPNSNEKQLKEKTVALVSTYFKTNSLARENKLTLTTAEKQKVAENVNSYWNIFGSYYSEFGITRETLTKVFTAEAYRDLLLRFYFGPGGSKEIPEARLYANFKTNYVLFKVITGYLTETGDDGKIHPISKEEAEKLILKFQNMSEMINSGEQTMEEASDYLASTGYPCSVQTVVMDRSDNSFPKGFFDKVKQTKPNMAKNIASKEFIFLILRADPGINSVYFKDKRTDLLRDVVKDDIDEIIEKAYTLDVNLSDSNFENYLTVIRNKKSEE